MSEAEIIEWVQPLVPWQDLRCDHVNGWLEFTHRRFWKWGGMELIGQGIGKILQVVIEIAKNLSKNEEGWF